MMGQHERTESLFYYFRLEDQIPEDHLLRLIDQYVDLSFVRERLKPFYSSTGRPSIDPEVLLRLLLIGYLYGITSERRLLEEVKMHLAYRWFTRLDFGAEIPDHSTFSKNRHGRFRQSGIFREVFAKRGNSEFKRQSGHDLFDRVVLWARGDHLRTNRRSMELDRSSAHRLRDQMG